MSNSFSSPWIVAFQVPLSMGFSRQEYWSGLPFPSPGDLPNPGIEPMSHALQDDSLPLSQWGRPLICSQHYNYIHKIFTTYPFSEVSPVTAWSAEAHPLKFSKLVCGSNTVHHLFLYMACKLSLVFIIIIFFSFGHTTSHVGSQFPNQGSNPCPLKWKCRVLTSGLPGKPLSWFLYCEKE